MKKFTEYATFPIGVVLGLVKAIFTEAEVCMMALTSIVLGILFGWLKGVAIFLATWTVFHMIGGYVSLLAKAFRSTNK
jgi:hypothetical protein